MIDTNNPPDGSASRAARDTGCGRVLGNQASSWKDDYAYYAEKFLDQRRFNDLFTGEDLRIYVLPYTGTPSHPNAWGASARGVFARWIRQKYIELHNIAPTKSLKSHASRIPQYRVIKGEYQ
jgi:hypothetical protein